MIGKVKSYLRKSNWLFYYYHYLRYYFKIITANKFVIIYTPGHVGSSSVYHSLSKSLPSKYLLLDVHSLDERLPVNPGMRSARHILQIVIRNNIRKILKSGNKVYLISVVRDPVLRSTSGYFQSLNKIDPEFNVQDYSRDQFPEAMEHLYSVLIGNDYRNSYLYKSVTHQRMWFEEQIKKYFLLDVHKDGTKKYNGFFCYEKDNVSLLVLKLEQMNEVFSRAVSTYLGETVEMRNVNTYKDRKGANEVFYAFFKDNFKLKKEVIADIYDQEFMQMFYTQEEIETFKKKWQAQ